MEIHIVIAIAAVLALGSLIQTTAGFGFALFTVPLLVLLGEQPHEAIVLVGIAAAAQACIGILLLRRHVRWSTALAMVALACAGMPFGVAALGALAEHDGATVRRLFGVIVLLALLVIVVFRVEPRARLPRGSMVAAMLTSGFMGGLSGMSGPPAVLWVMAHRWTNPEIRSTLWALFLGTTPVQILLLRYRFGTSVTDASLLALMLLPAPWLGLLPGLWLGHRIPALWLRRIAIGLLAVVALVALLRP